MKNSFIWRFFILLAIYAVVFVGPLLDDPEKDEKYRAFFAAAFGFVFFIAIFIGFAIFRRLLASLGVNMLSKGGDIIKTDFGKNIKSLLLRVLANLTFDTFLNLVFILYLIVLAVFSASVANEAARATINI